MAYVTPCEIVTSPTANGDQPRPLLSFFSMTANDFPHNQILTGDCVQVMQTLPDECADLIFADPPYNLQLGGELHRPDTSRVNTIDDAWDDFAGFPAYDAFSRAWLAEAQRLLKPRSSIWVCGSYHNIFRLGTIMQDMGFWLLNTIAWYKRDATPNFNGVRLKNDVEWLIWARRDKNARHKFNHHLMKAINGGKQHGSMWDIAKVKRYEQILDDNNDRLHNTQKPLELLERVILASTDPGDRVLDPFFGTGTTGAAAKHLRRAWLGIERDATYVDLAGARIAEVEPLPSDHLHTQPIPSRRPYKVPFKTLIREGYVAAGRQLYLKDGVHRALILPNGRLQYGEQVSTIHLLCRELLDVPSCNGWTVWYYEDDDGERHLLDDLRQRYRAAREGNQSVDGG